MAIGKNSINRANRAATQMSFFQESNEPIEAQKFYDADKTEIKENTQDRTVDFVATSLIVPSYSVESISANANFAEIVESVRKFGVLIPLLLRKVTGEGEVYYRILAGHKRFFAAETLGISVVPAQIIECDDKTAAEIYTEAEKYKTAVNSSDIFYRERDKVIKSFKQDELPEFLL